ncbi:MAG: hypothetical protein ACF8R7_07070 [Phycisphaerales bacterium JB039]
MMGPELAATLAQFGVAGLIAWLWITERRAAGERERLLGEAARRVEAERIGLRTLLDALGANTRALASLEATQRELIGAIRAGGRQAGGGCTPSQ